MGPLRCLVVLLAVGCSHATSEASGMNANPIRRVVTMLQNMQKKIDVEGKKQEDMFEKFMCYCKNGKGKLEKSVEDAKGKIEQLEADIKETDSALKQTVADLQAAKASRAEAKEAVAKATSIRERDAAAFAKESSELKTNLAATKKATTAIAEGMGSAFLQTKMASVLKQLSITTEMSSVTRDVLTAFLTQGQGDSSAYAPQSGEITGILKQMADTMASNLADVESAEKSAVSEFTGMMEAKTRQINTLTKEIETKTASSGEAGVALVTLKEDLDDTSKSLAEDTQFLKDLQSDCMTKAAEWETIQKIRAEELLAIADTIKILNDDDSLDLFKKTLPSTSLLQLTASSKAMKTQALAALKHHKGDFRLNLIALALKGKKVSFDKVIAMIDEMTTLLKREQVDDDTKKAYCEATIDKTEDEIKGLELDISDLKKAIADHKEGISTLTDEVASLADGIKALDAQVSEATATRKEEHADNTETLMNDNAAKEVIGFAKNRLNKFYNPKMYKAPPKRELSEEERIVVNNGGTLAPTAPPGGIAGTGVTGAFAQVAPAPPPETAGAYAKKGGESGGVIAMLDMMVADLDKEIQETEVNEKEGQKEYEQLIADSAEKRARDSKSIADKEAAKADLEASLLRDEEGKTATTKGAMGKHQYLADVHADCDFLLQTFETRKSARAGEVDAMTKAKAVLSGADYSLIQSAHVHHHRFLSA